MTRVLVIDDQADVRAMICIVLRLNHFEVAEAASAATGLNMFEQSAFDVAIVDVFLEDANGFDVVAAMRKKIPDFPVIAISGMPSFDTASHSAEQPSSHSAEQPSVVCLRKPFRPNGLLGAIEAALRLSRPADDGASLAANTG
jgi:DNA-binding NtrC family response regulator